MVRRRRFEVAPESWSRPEPCSGPWSPPSLPGHHWVRADRTGDDVLVARARGGGMLDLAAAVVTVLRRSDGTIEVSVDAGWIGWLHAVRSVAVGSFGVLAAVLYLSGAALVVGGGDDIGTGAALATVAVLVAATGAVFRGVVAIAPVHSGIVARDLLEELLTPMGVDVLPRAHGAAHALPTRDDHGARFAVVGAEPADILGRARAGSRRWWRPSGWVWRWSGLALGSSLGATIFSVVSASSVLVALVSVAADEGLRADDLLTLPLALLLFDVGPVGFTWWMGRAEREALRDASARLAVWLATSRSVEPP
jgi:hypothetical protein